VSLLSRPSPVWTIRLGAGGGAFAPTPFTEETEETGLSFLLPLKDLRAERARTASVDVTRRAGPFDVTVTAFGSVVRDPVQLRNVDASHVELVNMTESTETWGTELLARYRRGPFMAMVTHAWTRSTELDPNENVRREVPLTPRHAASFNAMWERDDWGRVGFEWYFTGEQQLDDNPYRDRSPSYALFGVLVERRLGPVRLFLNSENLGDVRQTKYDPLVLPAREPDGQWTVDAWAPLDGRVFNGGVRIAF
jgi:iron complex outermembrane receptor protein